ncbi:NAD(P)H-binding protein [Rhodococcus sp. X156]|uniref:NAD(P)-dependent oxidoreductase n=1 Tax=Rhodococcus sp. X156 TaxID=2499145 RepID=UPI000FDC67E7|nr:NAD(P)H-binding protein [Rhodococcus sp. X156]
MRVTVFGSTSDVGRLAVRDLLDNGHSVRAYVHEAVLPPASWSADVDVVVGEITDRVAVGSAVAGAEAVVSTLWPTLNRRRVGPPLVEGTRLVVEAMLGHGVRRYVGNATPCVLDPRESPTTQTRVVSWLTRTLLPRAYREVVGMSNAVMRTSLDWTIVRVILPTGGPGVGVRHVGFFGTDRIGWQVSKADLATFTADQVDSRRFLRAAPAISS